jgi:hypothetical protein
MKAVNITITKRITMKVLLFMIKMIARIKERGRVSTNLTEATKQSHSGQFEAERRKTPRLLYHLEAPRN